MSSLTLVALVGCVGWLVAWLVGWLVAWLVGWLVGWLVAWFGSRLQIRYYSSANDFRFAFPRHGRATYSRMESTKAGYRVGAGRPEIGDYFLRYDQSRRTNEGTTYWQYQVHPDILAVVLVPSLV
jgi:hypothetical protein